MVPPGRNSSATTPLFLMISLVIVFISSSEALEDPVLNVCTQINKYLESSYRCRPNEFHRNVACRENRVEIRCPRLTHIAIHSASYGWSDGLTVPDCPAPTGRETGCPRTCALNEFRRLCQGKRRCQVDADDGVVVDSIRCPRGSVKYLGVIHTCVRKSLLSHIVSSDAVFLDPCGDADTEDSEPGRPHPPFTAFPTTVAPAFRSGWMPMDSSENDEDKPLLHGDTIRDAEKAMPRNDGLQEPRSNTFGWHQRPVSTPGRSLREGFVRNGSVGGGGIRVQTVRPEVQVEQVVVSTPAPSMWMHSFMDWIWTWNYINENTEKFILYMLLGLSIGTITILFTILCHMIYCARRHPSKQSPSSGNHHQQGAMASCSSPTWRMPESESSTGDDRTLHDDDVELTSFNHIDSLQRHTHYHHQSGARPPSYSSRPQSPTVTATTTTTTTTATINRSYSQANPVVTRCFTPSPPTTTLPESSVVNGGFLPPNTLMSNGRVEVTPLPQSHCVGSLGRTYSSQYRRESYQLDPAPGCRTLQPMQHYYG